MIFLNTTRIYLRSSAFEVGCGPIIRRRARLCLHHPATLRDRRSHGAGCRLLDSYSVGEVPPAFAARLCPSPSWHFYGAVGTTISRPSLTARANLRVPKRTTTRVPPRASTRVPLSPRKGPFTT